MPAPHVAGIGPVEFAARPFAPSPRGEAAVDVVVSVQGEAELFEVVWALEAFGGFPDFLHRRQKETNQDRNDGDHDQELNQGKRPPRPPAPCEVYPRHDTTP